MPDLAFWSHLSEPFTAGFLGCVSIEKRAADGSRFRIARGRLDPLLPGDAAGKAFHHRRRWATPGITVDGSAEHRRSSGSSAVPELADDPLSDIAHRFRVRLWDPRAAEAGRWSTKPLR